MSPARALLRTSVLVLALGLLLAARLAGAAAVVDPALRFHTLTTPHFVIYFHQGEEPTARRLAAIAEETWSALQRPLAVTPPPRTHVMLVDQSELANGWASPVPYDTVFVTATWPTGSDFIGFTDDWLRLVFTHEYTHILHLDRSEGWARPLRRVFGRVPVAFPNLFLPLWQIEGLAVYEESMLTGEGRLNDADFRSIEETARREHTLEPIDRVNGGLTAWPAGDAHYAYGAAFQQFLADRYGPDTLATLANATARRVPYTSSLAFKDVYGKSLGDLWREFEAQPPEASSPTPAADDRLTRITRHGFTVTGPRFAPGCKGCPPEIVYALDTAGAFPSLNAVAVDGTNDRTLTTRYLGSTTGVSAATFVFDQDEIRRNVGLYSDLYVLDRTTGSVRALTSGSRLQSPDLSPDGTRIVCVREHDGQRDLVVLPIDRPDAARTIASEAETQFDTPRWSPDGRLIAAARHPLGGQSEIVVVDAGTGSLHVIASDRTTRFVTPAWLPGGRAIVAAADMGGGVFNLYEFDAGGTRAPRQLTHTPTGATWPDVSPDGKTIVFVGYTTSGFDLFTMPYPEGTAPLRQAGDAIPPTRPVAAAASYDGPAAPYTPWATLRPTSWMPYIDSQVDQLRAGVSFGGQDVLGYHAYAVSATWLVTAPRGAEAPNRAAPDWEIDYAYTRWRPIFFVSADRATSFFAGPPAADGTPSNATAREYQIEAGAELPIVHARTSHVVFASFFRSADQYNVADGAEALTRASLRGAWASTTARTYGYSISPEDGATVGATIEAVRRALGSFADATTVTADARAYLPGLAAHQVIAIRAAGGETTGSDVAGRTFLSGGPGPAASPPSFDPGALALLRGFPVDTFAGTRIAVVNADYRLPIAWPERGHGTWPLFLKGVSGAAFADAANAWTQTFRTADITTSAGAELSADFVAGYVLPITAAVGVGWGHDGSGRVPNSRTIYFRLGRAF